MDSERKLPKPDPLVEKLLKVAGEDSIVEMEGHVGPSDGETLRLYSSLELTEWVDVPRHGILHVEEVRDERKRVRAYVRGSAQVRVVSSRSTTVQAAQMGRAGRLGPSLGSIIVGPLPPPRIPPRLRLCLDRATAAYNRCAATHPHLEKFPDACDHVFWDTFLACLAEGREISPS
jgi:hypothetical protein